MRSFWPGFLFGLSLVTLYYGMEHGSFTVSIIAVVCSYIAGIIRSDISFKSPRASEATSEPQERS